MDDLDIFDETWCCECNDPIGESGDKELGLCKICYDLYEEGLLSFTKSNSNHDRKPRKCKSHLRYPIT